MKKLLSIGIILLFIGMSISSSTGFNVEKQFVKPLNGKTLYVGGSGPGNYTKIQDAIDNASDGDTVFVYDDSSPYIEWDILINKSIKLIGEDKNTTVIDGGGLNDVVIISANGVQISGFTLQNSYDSLQRAGIDIGANNAFVSNNIILDCCHGINMDGFRINNKIIDNTICSTRLYGIYLWDSCNNNLILNNTIHSNEGDGIGLFQCNNNNVLGNDIYSNRVGVYIAGSNNNMISDNLFSSNKDNGILLSGSDNTVCNNSFSNDGLHLSVWENEENIVTDNTVNDKPLVYLEHESDTVIDIKAGQIILVYCDNITIQNQELTHTSNGIQLVGTDNCFIYGNILSDNNRGIQISHFSHNNNIVGNTISNNSYGGIHGSPNRGNIEGNTISNNGNGIFIYGCGGNDIYKNLISNNLYGVKIWWVTTAINTISFNNFIDNKRDAGFHLLYVHRYLNWSNNYWERPRLLPKLVFGKMSGSSSKYYIPWVNFDWLPAQEPYDIEV